MYTIYLSLSAQLADPNPFCGTHCIFICLYKQQAHVQTEAFYGSDCKEKRVRQSLEKNIKQIEDNKVCTMRDLGLQLAIGPQ